MKPHRFRFRLRSLMIALALASLAAWGYSMWRRSREFAARATAHQFRVFTEEINIRSITDEYPVTQFPPRRKTHLTPAEKVSLGISERVLRYETIMYEKYLRRAYPWLPVAPDPPPPPGRWEGTAK